MSEEAKDTAKPVCRFRDARGVCGNRKCFAYARDCIVGKATETFTDDQGRTCPSVDWCSWQEPPRPLNSQATSPNMDPMPYVVKELPTPQANQKVVAETLEKNVNHPSRYTKGKVECIDAVESAIVGKPPDEAFCVGNVIRYLWRYEDKEPLRSCMSAKWYLERLIEKLQRKVTYES